MPRKTGRESSKGGGRPPGFNEAAARCRGKPWSAAASTAAALTGFNEAAARCRGKPSLGAQAAGVFGGILLQ